MQWKREILRRVSWTQNRHFYQRHRCSHAFLSTSSAFFTNCLTHVRCRCSNVDDIESAKISVGHTHPCRRRYSCHQRNPTIQHYSTVSKVKDSVDLQDVFSDANKKRAQAKLETVKPVRNVDTIPMRKELKVSAVLVPLCMVAGEPSILFTLRSSSLRKHRGEVSFPGGNQDKEDEDVVHTALRETHEELGLNAHDFDVWGHLHPTPDRRGKQVVYPVLARYTKDLDIRSLTLSADEVEEVFTCRIRDLCDKTKLGSTQFRTASGYTLPVFLAGPYRIWGLTAVILHQILMILAPGLYTFKLRHIS
ncbi:hypothetical protein BaRGS_00026243 [Batillaria attramentaria]|uniref:Nudix hydrolase domain-containing protein n=1 Tax=Batillaria attramentaria TaxID=370345 RepID=A0ABD0K630_9CAEN